MVSIAALVAMGCNFLVSFFSRLPKPFCDSYEDSEYSLTGLCEPCPSNGECYQGKLKCALGYTKHGKLCVEGGDINQTAKKLVREDNLWKDMEEIKSKEIVELKYNIYMHAKQRATMSTDGLFETRINTAGIKELKCPDALADHYKPFSCRMQEWTLKHALSLLLACALLLGGAFLLWRFRKRRSISIRANQLYHQVCDILEENAVLSKSENGEYEPWVVVSWLRDHLLLPRERKNPALWTKVEELVQEDSRLDRYPRLVKGEAKVVWEWQVEGSLSSSRMKKKREVSKLKADKPLNVPSDEQRWTSKAGEILNC